MFLSMHASPHAPVVQEGLNQAAVVLYHTCKYTQLAFIMEAWIDPSCQLDSHSWAIIVVLVFHLEQLCWLLGGGPLGPDCMVWSALPVFILMSCD